MKKIICILLTLTMLLAVAVGCTTEPPVTTADTEAPETSAPESASEPVTETETEPETETETETEEETVPVITEDLEAMNAEPAAAFTVSHAFGNNMVIQRNEYIRIWGWADESENGKRVEAEFGGLHGATVIADGHWLLTLGGTLPENTEGQTLRVFAADGVEYKYENVLVGDVYWVIGQSNIAYPVSVIKNEPLASAPGRNVEISDDLMIRLYKVGMDDLGNRVVKGSNDVSEDVVNPRGWQTPRRGALTFTAIGYFTAINMYNKLDRSLPIGLIEFDAGGCALHAFLPNEVRDALKVSKAKSGIYSAAGSNQHESSFMYNNRIYSFQNMPIKGIIWYQGESDCGTANKNNTAYATRFTAMINYFRDKHDQINHDYPVYIVELPPIYMAFDYARVRMTMGTIPTMLKNAHICSSADTWKDKTYENNLHPYNKWEVSVRMANIILANDYGISDLDYEEGPVPVSCELSDGGLTATVTFEHVGDGLTTYEGEEIKGVKIMGGKIESVTISGKNTLTVKADAKISAVMYNSSIGESFPETLTLCSSTGVPCSSFRINP
ncbi:MAG: hypothetical protein J5879_04005 [Clostridia bacterium]|nr:hypothetical protein [Clostridia bacterium]